ncbi:hypothetical protein GOODEAATRI_007213, partial [Goodea atripinnis]
CLDQNEQSGPSLPPPSAVPDCPICGKKFKSQKSRSVHLKRCSADMGVSPAVLLQALQRQAEESRTRKKPRKKTSPLDEETMMALALSSSLLDQQKEQQAKSGPSHSSTTPVLKWKQDAAKRCVKNKKVAVPRPPPLLLLQDAETALARLQERVSTLLLRRRAPSPPTPTRCPSSLPCWTGDAPLWQKSTLLDGGSTCQSDFYAAELQHLFTPVESARVDAVSSSTSNKPESSVPPVLPSCSQTVSSGPSTPGTGELHVGSQALRDLVELTEDCMTLTQYGCSDKGKTYRVALSRLSSDLSSMVNNPQLSDLQLQVDSGEIFFAHSFMVYARCPLLAEMVHESGFGVQEEGMPAAQRVLLSDVSSQAVLVLLHYLYSAHCSIAVSLRPHVLELASRFDLQELEQLCLLQPETMAAVGGDDIHENQEENANNHTDLAFMELLRSMWNKEDEDEDTGDLDGVDAGGQSEDREEDGVTAGDREIHEEHVNEEELEEIYEFAATQRQRLEQQSSMEEEDDEEDAEQGGDAAFTNLKPNLQLEPEPSLDRSYSRLFSQSWGVYDEGDNSSKSSTPLPHPAPHGATFATSGRTLLQSSASVVDELSLNLPIPGPSPGQAAHRQDDGDSRVVAAEAMDASLKQESRGPHGICIPLSPDSPAKKDEPELIVLSDSSEEMEENCRLSPQSYTRIKSSQNPSPKESVCNFEFSPGDPEGCSPELSWLIPSTPLQSGRNTKNSSVQTNSSMCRTQLFLRGDSSPPASPLKNKVQTFNSPLKPSASAGDTASRESSPKQSKNLLSISSSDLKVSPKKCCNPNKNTEVSAAPRSFRDSSKHETPLQPRFQPCSSTPLHTEVLQSPVPPGASPLNMDPEKQSVSGQMKERTSLESLENTESGSFQLSPVSNPSDPPSAQPNMQHGLKTTGGRNEQEEIEGMDCSNEMMGKISVADVRESSFHQSFMDEPPIAFNDSWGLDPSTEANPGCFSLRLEDTEESSPRERPGSFSTSKPPSSNSIQSPAPDSGSLIPSEVDNGLLDSKIWDSWEGDEEEEEGLPLSQRVNPAAQLKTPRVTVVL